MKAIVCYLLNGDWSPVIGIGGDIFLQALYTRNKRHKNTEGYLQSRQPLDLYQHIANMLRVVMNKGTYEGTLNSLCPHLIWVTLVQSVDLSTKIFRNRPCMQCSKSMKDFEIGAVGYRCSHLLKELSKDACNTPYVNWQ